MTLPFVLPDWAPWWVSIVLLVPALLFALAFLIMPFSVFGVKGRLDTIEERLDEIQGEIRSLVLRLPERAERESAGVERGLPRWADDERPPIPPAPRAYAAVERSPPPPHHRVSPMRGGRAEPRLDPH